MDGGCPADRGAMIASREREKRVWRWRVCLLYDLASMWKRRNQLNARISMSHANFVYTSPRLLLNASITSRPAGVWPHCLVLMKMIRLQRILWKLPGLWEGTSQEAILTARFTTGTIGLNVEGILGYARVTGARTRRTKRHVTTTRHIRE